MGDTFKKAQPGQRLQISAEAYNAFLDVARRSIEPRCGGALRVLGPVDAPMARKAGRYRAQLLLQSNVTAEPAARRKLLEQAETILMRDAPVIPIYDYVRRYLVAPSVRGWVTSGRGPTPSRFLAVEPESR